MHVVITGGTRGIGYGLVTEFLRLGHKVSFTGTSETTVSAAMKTLKGSAKGYVCDVRDIKNMRLFRDETIQEFGDIDIWINNAGVNHPLEPVYKLDENDIKKINDINITGMMFGTKVALEHMIERKVGIVYNMEGLGSNNMVIPKTIVYGSSKRLLRYFSKACNKELKDFKDVRVGTLQPGMVFTDLLMENMSKDGMKIARILGRNVSVVTQYLVKHMLKSKKNISFLTNRRVIASFITYPFRKSRIEV
jgi:NADP-dependent 3-hydroxy acid dehydrogenase YdfG